MILPVPVFGQRDARWAAQKLGTVAGATIGSEGCLITDMCMLAAYYGHPILPNEINDILTNGNMYYDGDLFVHGSITRIFSDIKFDKVVFCQTTPAPVSDIKNYLDQGKPMVVSLLNYGITHFILAVGYDGDRIYANDPWQGDQVAINDRWGDPAKKILQVNFFSGSVPLQSTPDPGGDEHGSGHNVVVQSETMPPQTTDSRSDSTITITPPPIQERLEAGLKKLEEILNVHEPKNNGQSNHPSFIDNLKSRKFILAVLASAVGFINSVFHLGITETQLVLLLIPVLAFIIAEGLADAFERARK